MQNIYRRGDIYDIAYTGFPGDEKFYLDTAESGNVLYLGIGTGRIFSKIFNINNKIIGIDNSPSMISKLFTDYPEMPKDQVILADVLNADTFAEGKFDKIIAPYAFLNYFTYKEIGQVLHNVYKWLKPGIGVFITDSFSPYKNPGFSVENEVYSHFDSSDNKKIHIEIEYDHVNQMLTESTEVTFSDGSKEFFSLENFYYYPNELRMIFENNLLSIINFHGGYNQEMLSTDSLIMVIEAKKQIK